MKVAVLINYVPFEAENSLLRGETLVRSLKQQGHHATLLRIPSSLSTKEKSVASILACRLLQIPNVDLVVGLEFPAYLVPHSNKILWLDEENPQQLPLAEARKIYVTSQSLADRLKVQEEIEVEVLLNDTAELARKLAA